MAHLKIYIISVETSIFAPQRLPFYKALGVAACTVGKVRASTVFMCVCSTFRSSDLLLFVKKRIRGGVRTLDVIAGHLKNICHWGDPAIVSLPRLHRRDTMGVFDWSSSVAYVLTDWTFLTIFYSTGTGNEAM